MGRGSELPGKIADLLRKNLLLIAIGLAAVLFYHCPFKAITGIPCPGCGMTSAILAALRLRFSEAFRLHPLFPVVMVELVYIAFRSRFRLNDRVELAICLITLAALLAVWLIRIIF